MSISQLVIVSLVHIMDTVDRAKMTKRWIEIANLLQSGTYGNLFSFMAVMKGLESPQVQINDQFIIQLSIVNRFLT